MQLAEIRNNAKQAATNIEIDWDFLESDPRARQTFESILKRAVEMIVSMENLHSKMIEGQSVLFDGEDSPLTYEMREEYLALVEEELFAAYQVQDVYERYTLIRSITELA
jgi:hypothetical protein